MAKFYQMQIANAMGTSDMSVVMKVLNGDLAKVMTIYRMLLVVMKSYEI